MKYKKHDYTIFPGDNGQEFLGVKDNFIISMWLYVDFYYYIAM